MSVLYLDDNRIISEINNKKGVAFKRLNDIIDLFKEHWPKIKISNYQDVKNYLTENDIQFKIKKVKNSSYEEEVNNMYYEISINVFNKVKNQYLETFIKYTRGINIYNPSILKKVIEFDKDVSKNINLKTFIFGNDTFKKSYKNILNFVEKYEYNLYDPFQLFNFLEKKSKKYINDVITFIYAYLKQVREMSSKDIEVYKDLNILIHDLNSLFDVENDLLIY